MPEVEKIAAVAPQECADMTALRAQIDRVDRALVALIAERTGYIARAAVIKQRRDTVHDGARIEDVVAKVKATAQAAGVPVEIVEPVWRELIARSIAHEFKKFDAKGS